MDTAFNTEVMGSFSEWWLALGVGLALDQRLGLATTLATVLAT